MVATPARVSPSLYRGWRPTRLQTAGLELFVRIQGQVHTVIHHWCLSLQTDHWSVFSRSRLWQWCNVLPPEGEGLRVWPTGSEGCGDIARQGLAEWCNTLTLNPLLAPAHSDGVQGLPDHALHWFKVPVSRRRRLVIKLQEILLISKLPARGGPTNNWDCKTFVKIFLKQQDRRTDVPSDSLSQLPPPFTVGSNKGLPSQAPVSRAISAEHLLVVNGRVRFSENDLRGHTQSSTWGWVTHLVWAVLPADVAWCLCCGRLVPPGSHSSLCQLLTNCQIVGNKLAHTGTNHCDCANELRRKFLERTRKRPELGYNQKNKENGVGLIMYWKGWRCCQC